VIELSRSWARKEKLNNNNNNSLVRLNRLNSSLVRPPSRLSRLNRLSLVKDRLRLNLERSHKFRPHLLVSGRGVVAKLSRARVLVLRPLLLALLPSLSLSCNPRCLSLQPSPLSPLVLGAVPLRLPNRPLLPAHGELRPSSPSSPPSPPPLLLRLLRLVPVLLPRCRS